jgi:NAD(P)H-nitrite reductase large subunit
MSGRPDAVHAGSQSGRQAFRHVIIGHGPAGLSAAEAIRRWDADASITIVSEEPYRFYSRPGLAYYLANLVPQEQLFSRSDAYYRHWRIDTLHARAEGIDPTAHLVHLAGSRRLPYDRLLLATGSAAARPNVPGIDLAGVVTLDTLSDTRTILDAVRQARSAVVVGGGVTALELIEGFLAHGLKVHYLMRHARYWSSVLDEAESGLVLKHLRDEHVEIHNEIELGQVLGRKGRVAGIETSAGQRIGCEVLGIAIGVQPRLELARQAGLLTRKGVLVDGYMRSGQKDIFAAGDIAEVSDGGPSGHLNMLWPVAIATGRTAGHNMAGANLSDGPAHGDAAGASGLLYRPGTPFNVCYLADLWVTIAGQVSPAVADDDMRHAGRGSSEAWQGASPDGEALRVVTGRAPGAYQRLHIQGNRLAGAVIMGDQRLATPARYLIEQAIDLGPVRADLLAPGADLAQVLLPFHEAVRA